MTTHRRLRWAFAAAAVAVAAAVASTGAIGAQNAEKVTLNLWMASGDPEQQGIADLVRKFEGANPGVDVVITYKSFADYNKIIALRLASRSAPDVLQGNMGYSLDSTMVKRKLIIPLEKYARQYGWTKLYTPASLGQYRLRDDGYWDGKSTLYGIGHAVDSVGVFYNKSKLRQLGLTKPPATLAQFESVLAKAKDNGERAFVFGNADGLSGTWVLGTLIAHYGNAAQVRNWLYGRPGATFTNAANRAATNKLLDWIDKGFVTDGFNGVNYGDSVSQFADGNGVFLITGNWVAATVLDKMKSNVGFFTFPRGPSGKHQAIGSLSLPWHISSRSKNPDLAAELVDTLSNRAAGPVLLDHGRVPAFPVTVSKKATPLLREIVASWQQVLADNGQLLYLDWSSTTMLNTLISKIQEVTGGKTSTADFLGDIQKNWADFQKTQKK
jgi:raffinose/stachyose/melibiose transport system substrate-binding protein